MRAARTPSRPRRRRARGSPGGRARALARAATPRRPPRRGLWRAVEEVEEAKVDAVRRSSCRSLRLAQRSEALGDALERLAGLEGEPHLAGGEAEVGESVELER